jgi:hypothetical protein
MNSEPIEIAIDTYKLHELMVWQTRHSLSNAIRSIDQELGDGYAREHPELIAGFMQAESINIAYSVLSEHIRVVADLFRRPVGILAAEASRRRDGGNGG